MVSDDGSMGAEGFEPRCALLLFGIYKQKPAARSDQHMFGKVNSLEPRSANEVWMRFWWVLQQSSPAKRIDCESL